ncbi:MAG: carbon storage regulator [Phycisphaerales bacterium]
MLVITRREGEEVVVGDPRNPIGVVRIASIRGDRVRIAFDFPRTVQIHRREVAEQIVDEGDPPQIVATFRPKQSAEGNATGTSNGTDGHH